MSERRCLGPFAIEEDSPPLFCQLILMAALIPTIGMVYAIQYRRWQYAAVGLLPVAAILLVGLLLYWLVNH